MCLFDPALAASVVQVTAGSGAIDDHGLRQMAVMESTTRSIGRYRLLSELGRGSMGRVYLAEDPVLKRRVALKLVEPASATGTLQAQELQTRFLIEARAAARLDHPGVVAIYDADRDPDSGQSYMAMEWVDGPSLHERLSTGGPLSVANVVEIGRRVAEALHCAHQQGLIHRDVKPGNILLGRNGEIKLSDFGIAKVADLELTATGQVLGTPFYMSPEQIRDEPLDGRSDLFSLGVVLYRCLAGQLPFAGDSLPTITHKILSTEPTSVRRLNPEVTAPLAEVVRRALAKRPDERFSSGEQMAAALESAVDEADSPVEPTLVLPGARRDARTPRRMLLVCLCALIAGTTILGLRFGVPGSVRGAAAVDPAARPQGGSRAPIEAAVTGGDSRAAGRAAPSGELQASPRIDSAPLQPGATSHLDLLYNNRLKKGWISVWVDGAKVASRDLRSGGGIGKRAFGTESRLSIPVSAGRHSIEVRVTGAAGKVDAAQRVDAILDPGATHVLRAVLIPPGYLRLSWK